MDADEGEIMSIQMLQMMHLMYHAEHASHVFLWINFEVRVKVNAPMDCPVDGRL